MPEETPHRSSYRERARWRLVTTALRTSLADFVNDADCQLRYHRFMCFVLYAGTTKSLSTQDVAERSSGPVRSVAEPSATSRSKGTSAAPKSRYVGSTSGCGCDFPYVNLQKGNWPIFEVESDPERDASDRYNRKALVALLQESGDKTVELYGVWDGDFAKTPRALEEISLQRILDSDFRFKEQGFYRVTVKDGPTIASDRADVGGPR